MKLRIYYDADNKKYYPQFKNGWFFWDNFLDFRFEYPHNIYDFDVRFDNLEDAKNYLQKIIDKETEKKNNPSKVVFQTEV